VFAGWDDGTGIKGGGSEYEEGVDNGYGHAAPWLQDMIPNSNQDIVFVGLEWIRRYSITPNLARLSPCAS
jgi:hypothetical protein